MGRSTERLTAWVEVILQGAGAADATRRSLTRQQAVALAIQRL